MSTTERLTITNNIGELGRAQEWVEATGHALALPDDVVFSLRLCLVEAVSNVITYAFDDDTRHDVALTISRQGGRAYLEIEDDGRPFNPLVAPPAPAPLDLDDADIGGLGIDLIRNFTDDLRYVFADGRNHLIMGISLNQM